MFRTTLIFVLLLFSVSTLMAETYRKINPDGSIEFGDKPSSEAEKIDLPNPQSFSDPFPYTEPEPTPEPAPIVEPKQAPTSPGPQVYGLPVEYSYIGIESPAYEETVFYDTNGMEVLVHTEPELAEGHLIVIFLDDNEVSRQRGYRHLIPRVHRGTHEISAGIIDETGSLIMISDPVLFFMRQHSRNFK